MADKKDVKTVMTFLGPVTDIEIDYSKKLTISQAQEILKTAGIEIHCPEGGNDATREALIKGDKLVAAAAQVIGMAQCGGHGRACRMEMLGCRLYNEYLQGV